MPGSKCCRHPRSPTPLMPCQGKQSKQLWLQKIMAGLCFQHQINGSPLHTMVYLDPLNVKKKKKKDNPQEPETITLKLTCVCSWLCLLPLVSAHASRYLGDHWLCSLLYPTNGVTNKHHQNQRHPSPPNTENIKSSPIDTMQVPKKESDIIFLKRQCTKI